MKTSTLEAHNDFNELVCDLYVIIVAESDTRRPQPRGFMVAQTELMHYGSNQFSPIIRFINFIRFFKLLQDFTEMLKLWRFS